MKIFHQQFLDLVELESQGAEQIYNTMLNSLNSAEFSNEYLKQNLIGFCSDGASVMLGRNSGVGTRLQENFPKIVICHCFNHRLQLVLDDSVNDIEQVNHPVNIHHRANVGFSAAGLGESWQNCQHLTNDANFLPMIYF